MPNAHRPTRPTRPTSTAQRPTSNTQRSAPNAHHPMLNARHATQNAKHATKNTPHQTLHGYSPDFAPATDLQLRLVLVDVPLRRGKGRRALVRLSRKENLAGAAHRRGGSDECPPKGSRSARASPGAHLFVAVDAAGNGAGDNQLGELVLQLLCQAADRREAQGEYGIVKKRGADGNAPSRRSETPRPSFACRPRCTAESTAGLEEMV